MLTDGDLEMSNGNRLAVRGIAMRGAGILIAAAFLSSMLACSKQEPVAATNATVNAAMTNLDTIAVAKPIATKQKPTT